MKDFLRTIKLAGKNKKLTFFAMLLPFIGVAINLIQPQLYASLFNLIEESIRSNANTIDDRFWYLIIAYLVTMLTSDAINSLQYYTIVRWWLESKKRLTEDVFNHLHTLSVDYFEKNSTGKIKERIDRGISDLNNVMEATLMDVLPQFVFVVAAAIILYRTNVYFGLILTFAIPIFILISAKYTKPLIKLQDESRSAYEALSGSFTESIINAKTIKSFATEGQHKRKIINLVKRTMSRDLAYTLKRITMNVMRFLIINMAQISIMGLGVYWAIIGQITIGDFVLAWSYTNRSIQPLWYLTRVVDNVFKDMRSVKRVFELMDTEPKVKDNPTAKKLTVGMGQIRFNDVSFKYEDEKRKKIVKNFTLDVPAGHTVAFVGKSGVGKSTLIKLLLRFYDLQKGSIMIDGQNIANVTQKSLRENIGVVMQDSILFNDSALNNIKYGGHAVPQKSVITAAKAANAHAFIEELPKKYNTVVGERGVKLSGGEQQRINIARALLKNPPILVLDEATSSLDSESEQMIQDALWTLVKGRTTLIIAHRLSTVMRADLIVVMDKGKIAEMGKHEELIKKKDGIYANLYEIQSGGYLS